MTDNAYEMASAYCDGELDSDARSVVEGDQHLLAIVAEIMAQRTETIASLGDPIPTDHQPSLALRKAHLAAAGDAFDELYGSSSEPRLVAASAVGVSSPTDAHTPSDTTAPAKTGRSYPARLFALAAGVMVVAAVGIVAVRGSSTTDDLATSAFDGAESPEESRMVEEMADEAGGGDTASLTAGSETTEAMEASSEAMDETDLVDDDSPTDADEALPAATTQAEANDGGNSAFELVPDRIDFPAGSEIPDMAALVRDSASADYQGCAINHYQPLEILVEAPIRVGSEDFDLAIIELDQGPFAVLFDLSCAMVDSGPISG